MKTTKSKIRFGGMLAILVLALGLTMTVAKADFTFGTPTNLGPVVNSSSNEGTAHTSADGLTLFFHSNRPGGFGDSDLWVTTRATTDDDWGEPVNLGPTVNSSSGDGSPCISADGLSLYFSSGRPGGSGNADLWVATRPTTAADWETPVNLGPTVNSGAGEVFPSISADGLQLYFCEWEVFRPGGYGNSDMWVTTRRTVSDPWGTPVNLGATVNSSASDGGPSVSADGLELFFDSFRPGGSGDCDLWVATRETTDDPWGAPVNLGAEVNSSSNDGGPSISADGLSFLFHSNRSGGFGSWDIWQVPIEPVVDLNGDGIVDCADMCIMVGYWGTDEPLCDIGPTPFGDGIVDVQDLIVLAEHLFEGIPPVELEDVHVDADNDGSQVELEQGQILVVTLESNPTTGYSWEQVESQDSILLQTDEAEFKPSDTGEPPLVGAGGWEIFRFEAIGAGQMTLQLVYRRSWEEGVEPINTFSIEVVVN